MVRSFCFGHRLTGFYHHSGESEVCDACMQVVPDQNISLSSWLDLRIIDLNGIAHAFDITMND